MLAEQSHLHRFETNRLCRYVTCLLTYIIKFCCLVAGGYNDPRVSSVGFKELLHQSRVIVVFR